MRFFRDVGVPTIMISDGHQLENRSKEVRALAGKYRVGLQTTEAHQQR